MTFLECEATCVLRNYEYIITVSSAGAEIKEVAFMKVVGVLLMSSAFNPSLSRKFGLVNMRVFDNIARFAFHNVHQSLPCNLRSQSIMTFSTQ